MLFLAASLAFISSPSLPQAVRLRHGDGLLLDDQTVVRVVGLAWHLRHPPSALSPPAGALQPDANRAVT